MIVQNVNRHPPCKLEGLERFYMAGQWVRLGSGVPGGTLSGRSAIQQLCRDLGHAFLAE
jgi:phytoene dehydrogenase-like protein